MAVGAGVFVGVWVGKAVDVGNKVTVGTGGKAVGVITTGALAQADIKVSNRTRERKNFVFIFYRPNYTGRHGFQA